MGRFKRKAERREQDAKSEKREEEKLVEPKPKPEKRERNAEGKDRKKKRLIIPELEVDG